MLAYSVSKYYAVTRQKRRTRRCFPPCSRIRHSKRKKDKKDFSSWRTLLRMVNRRIGNRSITSLRSRRRQTTVSHSRAGLNTDSRNPCHTASRSNTDNRNLMDSLSHRCRSMVSRGRCRTSARHAQPTASQPAVPQPAMPQYAQSQQYGQPQPPMPGNSPSQQAGAAAKNKPPVAIIIGAVAAVVVITPWQRYSSLRIASAVPITRKRWSKRRRWKAAIQPSMRNSARRRAQRTTIHRLCLFFVRLCSN